MDRFDFVIIGAGAAGEAAAHAARKRGASVAVVDRELFGGACSFWACIPSKSLLHAAAEHHHGGDYSWQRASNRRDYMINREHRDWPDDSGHVKQLEEVGARLYRGEARIAGPGVVEVRTIETSSAGRPARSHAGHGGRGATERLGAGTIIVAIGSQSKLSAIEGLAEAQPWTSREATSTRELPSSLVVLGGGASGVELASMFARYGVKVTLAHSHDRLLEKDHVRNSEAIARILREDGVELRLRARARRVQPGAGNGGAHVVELSDGGYVEGEKILVALGREYGLETIGFENLGLDSGSLPRDGRLKLAEGVYLIGDPAGPELFTHVGHYQGGMAVRMALGEDLVPEYRAIPRAVYLEPEVASVGMDLVQALDSGADAFELVTDFTTTARGYELEARFGHLAIVVDRASRTLLGGSVVAPDASAAIHEIVLAIHARVPISTLCGMLHAYPSTSRAFDGLFADAAVELQREPQVVGK
jgi:pyruvate/2-oxoglutarate dehydrogenase complex dihydrolipoamide dehydrogenase (E3) component